jgi:hypothetical protein
VLSSLIALNYTAFNSLPFAFLKETINEEEGGLYIGIIQMNEEKDYVPLCV